MSLVDRIDSLLPSWMLTAPRTAMGLLMAGLAGLFDGFLEAVDQARIAAVPGQVRLPGVPGLGGFESCDALDYIARDRAVVQPMAGQPWDVAALCRSWLDDAARQTGPFGILDALAATFVPDTPLLRLVTFNGAVTSWYTRQTDGTRRLQRSDGQGFYLEPNGTSGIDATAAATWDWCSTTVPPPGDAGDLSGFFVIVYAPASSPYLTATDGDTSDLGICGDLYNDPAHVAAKDSPWAGTCGTNAPIEMVERTRAVITSRRAAGNVCRYIVIAFDPASFNPDGSSSAGSSRAAYPGGDWGYASVTDPSVHARVPSRLQTACYWPGAPGGRAK